jgi:transposase
MKPYSTDLRMRVVQAYENREGAMRQLATTVRVSVSSVRQLLKYYRETGSVAPKPHGGGYPATVDVSGLEVVQALGQAAPDATLRELCQQFEAPHQLPISMATMSRVLARLQLTRKKKRFTPRHKSAPRCSGSGPPSARRSQRLLPRRWSLSTNPAVTTPGPGTMAVPLGGGVPLGPSQCNAGHMSRWSGRWAGSGWWRP